MSSMIQIRFADGQMERRALGYLAGRFSFKSFDDGTTLVPETALGHLAAQGIRFTVQGPAAYDQIVPTVRDSAAADVQR